MISHLNPFQKLQKSNSVWSNELGRPLAPLTLNEWSRDYLRHLLSDAHLIACVLGIIQLSWLSGLGWGVTKCKYTTKS
jgi:hypothetical protein